LNSCSKIRTLLAGLALASVLPSRNAEAVPLTAVYYASCQREVGVIIHVDDDTISLLTDSGEIKPLRRFDVIYLAQYPVSDLPIREVKNPGLVPRVVVKTLFKNELVELASGWPVDFSEEKISFLTLDGQETIIDRDSIWSVEIEPFQGAVKFSGTAKTVQSFAHPYPFANCPATPPKDARVVFPQQLLGDRLIIKNEFDRLKAGHEKLVSYKKDQKFYPVPQIYPNRTTLGLWFNHGSRHAVSKKRNNSFVPAVISTLSEGPFGFQRTLVTGAAPMSFTVHEEPQTQFYYRLKANYVHFSYFYDIDRVLIGEESYKWRKDDLDDHDDRVSEVHHIAGGFDYGNYAIGLGLPTVQYAVRVEDSFFIHRVDMQTLDLSYEDRRLHAQIYFGRGRDQKEDLGSRRRGGNQEDENESAEVKAARKAAEREEELKPEFVGRFDYVRTNLQLKNVPLKPFVSLIHRTLAVYHQEDSNLANELTYFSRTMTAAVYLNYAIDSEIGIAGYVSGEDRASRVGQSKFENSYRDRFLKAGLNWTLSF
jgi:hypothetical protein